MRESVTGISPSPTHETFRSFNPQYYEDELHAEGVVTQEVTLLHPLAS